VIAYKKDVEKVTFEVIENILNEPLLNHVFDDPATTTVSAGK
jgi:hypothetical protein